MGPDNDMTTVLNRIDGVVNRLDPGAGVLRLTPEEALRELIRLCGCGNAMLIEALSRSLIIEHTRRMYARKARGDASPERPHGTGEDARLPGDV
jgi:hypothetical protein